VVGLRRHGDRGLGSLLQPASFIHSLRRSGRDRSRYCQSLGLPLIVAARQQAYGLLGLPLIQRLGDWSYSIYLWHWPVMGLCAELALFPGL